MISDEMRELLSAYVDDELRDADAARVEEMTKRDPELRREVDAYRTLRQKLRDWDDAEHGVLPAETLKARALARARTLLADRRQAARGRLLAIALGPAGLAAALLVAATVGLLAARRAPDAASPASAVGRAVEIAPLTPYGELALEGSALLPYTPQAPAHEPAPGLHDLFEKRARGYLWNGEVLSLSAIEFLLEQEELEAYTERRKLRRLDGRDRERNTRSYNLYVEAAVRGYEAVAEPYEGMVLISHRPLKIGIAGASAVPAGTRIATDQKGQDTLNIHVEKIRTPVLLPLGEVWVGAKDKSGRTRVVTASHLTTDTDFVAMAWADAVEPPANRMDLEVQNFILGPQARRRLLRAQGNDRALRDWLATRYGPSLKEAFAAGAKGRDARVGRLVAALAREPSVTGFAVVGKDDRVLGVELFANHDLMLAFAPRLLRGYLFEAGDDIRLKAPRDGLGSPGLLNAARILETTPERTAELVGIEKGTQDGLRRLGLRQVELRTAVREVVGHGILQGDNPIHLTIFGE